MPSVSKKQHNLMALVANDPKAAKRLGIKQSVGKEFLQADKGKKFKGGGMAKSDMKEDTKMDMAQDKAMIKKAFKQHDEQEHKGSKGTKLSLKKGGVAKTVTKEMEYDYKSGKKSFNGSTAKRDQHAEKEGKIVAKHLAYDKDMDMMKKGGCVKKAMGGRIAAKGEHAVQKQSKRGAEIFKKGGVVEKGTGEKYSSKAAMMKHEKKESKAEEMKEHGMCGGGMAKKYVRGGGIEIRGKTRGKIC